MISIIEFLSTYINNKSNTSNKLNAFKIHLNSVYQALTNQIFNQQL